MKALLNIIIGAYFGFILTFVGFGFILTFIGFSPATWQFWAVLLPVTIGYWVFLLSLYLTDYEK